MLNLTRNINPTQTHINDWVDMGNGMIAHRYGILSTSLVDYDLYVQTETGLMPAPGEYSTITHDDEYGWMGSYTTKGLPPELDALPAYSEERSKAVRAYFKELEQVAEIYIRSAFPQDFL